MKGKLLSRNLQNRRHWFSFLWREPGAYYSGKGKLPRAIFTTK